MEWTGLLLFSFEARVQFLGTLTTPAEFTQPGRAVRFETTTSQVRIQGSTLPTWE